MNDVQKKHILLIDDEEAWLRILSYSLKNQGYEVRTAQNGNDALAALKSYKPDLILTDVRMPDMNGFDLLQTIKHLPKLSSTPVVIVSAIDDYDARKTARELGAADYLVKPFDENDVNVVVAKYLSP